ncbi:MAG: TraB/GumN family protein [Proteobacteria bacterium]|nr:TraB/GumN family protein [Pseudomonadota bacterium]
MGAVLMAGVAGMASAAVARAPSAAAAAAATVPPDTIQEVVVEGSHEGPRMWTVRQGNHTLWILGTITPLPKKMTWDPRAVQEVLRQSQEVVPAWPSFGVGANPITALRVYIEWRRLQKPPDQVPLRTALPPPLYARVEALRLRYDPHDRKLENMRPMLAARTLMARVFDRAGLALHNEVQQSVLQLAREQGVRVRQDKLRIEQPVDVLRDVGTAAPQQEVACLESVVTLLETDLPIMQARARAWALGDVAQLRQLPHTDNRSACVGAISTTERVRALVARAQDDWILAVTEALRRNQGTLAVQSMDRLLGPDGSLELLRRRGYEVEGP